MWFQRDTARAAVICLLACAAGLDRLAANIVGATEGAQKRHSPRSKAQRTGGRSPGVTLSLRLARKRS